MSYKSFSEYLDCKGKVVEKPSTETVPDYKGKPNPEGKGSCKCKNVKDNQVIEQHVKMTKFREYLDAKGKLKKPKVALDVNDFPTQDSPPSKSMPPSDVSGGKPAPYKAGKGGMAKKGFGDEGCCPPYQPNTKDAPKPQASLSGGGKKQPQVESFISEMNLAEMTAYVNDQNREFDGHFNPPMVTAYMPGKFMPDPVEAIEYVTHLAAVNPKLMETVMRSLKSKTSTAALVSEMAKYSDTFQEIANLFEGDDGLKHAGSLCRAMNDLYSNYMEQFSALNESALSPPMGKGDEELEDEEDEDWEDEDEEGDDEEDEPDPADEIPDEISGQDADLKAAEDDLGDEDMGPVPQMRPKKPARRFGHDNLVGAMGGHKQMLAAMKKCCGVM